MKIIIKSYPGHKGRPGQVGGSLPKSGSGGAASSGKKRTSKIEFADDSDLVQDHTGLSGSDEDIDLGDNDLEVQNFNTNSGIRQLHKVKVPEGWKRQSGPSRQFANYHSRFSAVTKTVGSGRKAKKVEIYQKPNSTKFRLAKLKKYSTGTGEWVGYGNDNAEFESFDAAVSSGEAYLRS